MVVSVIMPIICGLIADFIFWKRMNCWSVSCLRSVNRHYSYCRSNGRMNWKNWSDCCGWRKSCRNWTICYWMNSKVCYSWMSCCSKVCYSWMIC